MDAYLEGVREREDALFRQAEMSPSPAMRRVGELKAKLASEGKLACRHTRRPPRPDRLPAAKAAAT
jgi:hypothetical protein